MKIYYAAILDFFGNEILRLNYTGSAKHSAFLAQAYIKDCPYAFGFRINIAYYKAADIAKLLNRQGRD